jgi:hypothetical protein
VLTDPTQSEEFRNSKHWQSPLLDFQLRVENSDAAGPAFRSNSLSGNERNRLLIAGPEGFHDESLVSGIDCKEDARSFAVFDFDRDGWLDIALASANAPRLRIFRNNMGGQENQGRLVRLKLIGTKSNRDACGARIMVKTSKGIRAFQKTIGEGLSSQNSGFIHITLAAGEQLESLEVRWSSGQLTRYSIEGAPDSISLTE